MSTSHKTLDHVRTYHAELTGIRRDLHANPELGLDTPRTADLVARQLESWGIEVHRGVGGHGVVGVLRSGNDLRSIGLRADMDALPIAESTGRMDRGRSPSSWRCSRKISTASRSKLRSSPSSQRANRLRLRRYERWVESVNLLSSILRA